MLRCPSVFPWRMSARGWSRHLDALAARAAARLPLFSDGQPAPPDGKDPLLDRRKRRRHRRLHSRIAAFAATVWVTITAQANGDHPPPAAATPAAGPRVRPRRDCGRDVYSLLATFDVPLTSTKIKNLLGDVGRFYGLSTIRERLQMMVAFGVVVADGRRGYSLTPDE